MNRQTNNTMQRPKVGLDSYSLTGPTGHEISDRDIFNLLRAAHALGSEGLQAFLPDDPGKVLDAFLLAAELDMYLEPYIQLPVHWQHDQAIIEKRRTAMVMIVNAAAEQGVRSLHCTMGARERFTDLGRWKAFIGQMVGYLRQQAPMLREHGLRIGIENHWDFSTYEIVQIVEQVGPDVVGVGLDTGNLPILGEAFDPALERCPALTVTTHLKDVYLMSTDHGAGRPIVPLGQGQARIADFVSAIYDHHPEVHFTIEDHSVIYPIDYFDSNWLAAVPELTTFDVASLARLVREGDRWIAEHRVPDPHAAELVPWSIRGPVRLAGDLRTVKEMLTAAMAASTGQHDEDA